jgi:hypothetical protein
LETGRALKIALISATLGVTIAGVTVAPVHGQSAVKTGKVFIQPFGSQGHQLAPGYASVKQGVANCWERSMASNVAGAWRCMSGNFIYDPCYQAPNRHHWVACPVDALTPKKVAVFRSLKSLPFGDAFPPFHPWALRLVNGAACQFDTGATGTVNGKRLNYDCSRNNLFAFGAINRRQAMWHIRVGHGLHGPLRWAAIRFASF